MAHKLIEPGMSLQRLLDGIATVTREVIVTDITMDSRQAVAGGAFLACRGMKSHGLQHAQAALAAGVRAVLWEPMTGLAEPAMPTGVVALAIPDLSRRLGEIADRFFGSPSRQVRVAAITGTNGKTTSAWLLAQALESGGVRAGYGGTIGWGRAGGTLDTASAHTTPDCISVHRRICDLGATGARALAMEVSSHALAQDRVAGVRFDTAVFTNLSRDHLDYHADMQDYGAAKARLFSWPDLKHRVINMGDEFGRRLASSLPAGAPVTAVWAGEGDLRNSAGGFVHARERVATAAGLEVQFDSSWGSGRIRSRLIGDFNAENLIGVLAVLLLWGIPVPRAVAALETADAPPGRMETFRAAGRPLAVVDYAHSPDALAKALQALRGHTGGKLWCLFGCGGDRDAGKRPIMGAIAAELADEVVLTDDNPRTEDPQHIVRQIAEGISTGTSVHIERDRARAIAWTLQAAGPRDVVLIAGKGHEDYQIYGTQALPFSDRAEVRRLQGGAP